MLADQAQSGMGTPSEESMQVEIVPAVAVIANEFSYQYRVLQHAAQCLSNVHLGGVLRAFSGCQRVSRCSQLFLSAASGRIG